MYLKTVAERLVYATRKQDTLARWGGDEFVLMLEDMSERQPIADAMGRLLEQLAQPIYLEGHELLPTASIGISRAPQDGRVAADLIKAADAAMYRAKEAGRNCFEFYAQTMSAELDQKLLLATELRHALQEQQFFLVYQPQVDAVSSEVIGVEALVRWRHPSRGVLAPAAFLPLMDEFGLMAELGEWVLAEACRQMHRWTQTGTAIPRVAVNVAPCQLKASFVGTVARILAETEIAPECLEIEITEGSLESGDVAQTITSGLRDLGVLLSVDDFGTGYSSLSHIKMFPITCFKIDKSFVDGVPDSEDDAAIVRTILALGSSLHVDVVAEGAETLEQVEFLRAEGVKYIQGYYFARPMLPEAIDPYLAKRQ
jgi:predicted signal transduction protein with EAL and GGDEF domain